ncbi:centlein-like [Schistocerca serialis cubense]|uniref:centlein-like n=1 Tax=Schistocerca serialis cubense TaxID=2023355 RepID=UPI00214E8C37|nr:centlein-like [Schistocerca serialis cubense]XP_049960041.1 centlein-like [Schistocerca serialis cubense]
MRQFHYRFMELEPVAEEDEPQSLPQQQQQQQQQQAEEEAAAAPDKLCWPRLGPQVNEDGAGDNSEERVQRLEDEVAELRELNELLEFRLLEMEHSDTGGSHRCCCGPVCMRSQTDNTLDKAVPGSRIVATVLPFTAEQRSPPPMRPKLSDSSHESGIFDSDDHDDEDRLSDEVEINDQDDDRGDDDDIDTDDGFDTGSSPRASPHRRLSRNKHNYHRCQVMQGEVPAAACSQATQTDLLWPAETISCASQTDEPVGCGALTGEIQKLALIREHMEQRARLEQRCQLLESRRQEEQRLLRLWMPAALAWALWRVLQATSPNTQRSLTFTPQPVATADESASCKCCERLQVEHENVMRCADEVWSELEQQHERELRHCHDQLQQREEQLQQAERRLHDTEEQLRTAEADRESLQMERTRLRRQVSQLLEAVSAADASLQQLQAEVDDVLRPELRTSRQLHDQMRDALAAAELRFQNEVNESNSKLQQVTNELNEINCECEQLREEVETLEATVRDLRAEIQIQKDHEKATTATLNRHIVNLEQMLNNAQNHTCGTEEPAVMCKKHEDQNMKTLVQTAYQQKEETLEEQTSRIINGTFPNLEGPIDELTKVVRSLDSTLEYIKEIKETDDDNIPLKQDKNNRNLQKPEVPPKKFLLGNNLMSTAKRGIVYWNDISCAKTTRSMQSWSFTNGTLGNRQEKHLVQQK